MRKFANLAVRDLLKRMDNCDKDATIDLVVRAQHLLFEIDPTQEWLEEFKCGNEVSDSNQELKQTFPKKSFG